MTDLPLLPPGELDWRSRAACLGEDPELFFPLTDAADDAQVARARAVCRRCRVLLPCRTWAIDHGEDDGIWGATTAAQRRAVRRATTEPRPARRGRGERGGAASEAAGQPR
ncbi:WhiB family transcriptional regulator [Streptomyces sp. NPDC093094]|uniref:WhiB family transcriptional regulator n=1 Tax=Streptomyces sp. NPDC093094 TaxID=3366026 RepID=UPI003811975F